MFRGASWNSPGDHQSHTSLSSCLPSGVNLTGFAACEASFPLFGFEEWVPLA
ncbi:uncharacterized protein BT62DRAFT_927785 [Guyanagaster necrorhizus]|uniref:Uncharacterized protein n=1 Tax=Guyanagaster necrorhizus TaxID=856835 RepID=A0A9P8AWM7_9AGAR|nr:uncharacterized protein BT62DRAFT_927785 [Guyanagaster necrorhizus MCA 3950]KAG7450500.1 hypothetical protein BT62DRAFT_927785 [Guyanagaster necrorhizus MCA 3950]